MDIETAVASAVGSAGTAGFVTWIIVKAFLENAIKASVKHALDKNLADYKAGLDKALETDKSSLRNSETIFQRQLEALRELKEIQTSLIPDTYHVEDWDDARQVIAFGFLKHRARIQSLLVKAAGVLPRNVQLRLEGLQAICSNGENEVDKEDFDVSTEGYELADQLYTGLHTADTELEEVIRKQVGDHEPENKLKLAASNDYMNSK